MSKNMVEPQTTNDVTVWRICFAYWIIKTTRKDAHMRMHTPTLSVTHTRTYARMRTHTQTNV